MRYDIDGNLPIPTKDTIDVGNTSLVIPYKKQLTLLKRQKLYAGQKMFKVKDGVAEEASYTDTRVEINQGIVIEGFRVKPKTPYLYVRDVLVEEGYFYVPATNKRNALRKYKQELDKL